MKLQDTYAQESVLEKYVPLAGQIAVDVGANEGQWSRFLCSRFREVHAVECQGSCVNTMRAAGIHNLTVHHTACWSNIGRLMFHTNVNPHGEHQGAILGTDAYVLAARELDRYEVECRPLDTLPIPAPVDFLKVDVEGSEVQVLVGAQAILGRDRPTLLVETHTDENRAFLLTWLRKLGYDPVIVSDMIVQDKSRWTDVVNYLYAPRGS
jgi:FkbM family methyltransferase